MHPWPCCLGAQGLEDTRDAMWTGFVNRVRDNLHVLLALSPVGDAFRSRCRRFPSLLAATTIDWFSEWPQVGRGHRARVPAHGKLCIAVPKAVRSGPTSRQPAFFSGFTCVGAQ